MLTLLNLTGTGNNYDITVTDTIVNVGNLNIIDGLTTHTVDITAVTTLTGLALDVFTTITNFANFTGTASLISIQLLDDTALATDLINLDNATSITIDASSIGSIAGSSTDINTVFSGGFSGLGAQNLSLSDTTITATTINSLDVLTSGSIDLPALTLINGASADVLLIDTTQLFRPVTANVTLTDASVSVLNLNTIASFTTGAVTATVAEHDVASLLNLTETGNAYTISVTDASVLASDLNIITTKTINTVDASTVTTFTGANADVLNVFNNTNLIVNNQLVILSDVTLAAADLNTLNGLTNGAIDASSVTTLTGSSTDVSRTLTENVALTITGLGAVNVTLENTTISATDINALNLLTTGVIDASSVEQWSGSIADANTALGSVEISGIDNADLALTDTTATTTALTSLDNLVNGTIDAATVVTITGLIADASNLITSTGIINLDAVDITLTDLSAAATALTTLVGLTTGVIDAASVLTVTGTLAEATAALTDTVIHNLESAAVTLSDATLAAADLNTLNGLTNGAIDASSVTTLTGSSTDVSRTLTENVALTITGLGAVNVTLENTTISATDINALNLLTTGVIDASSVEQWSGSIADANTALGSVEISGIDNADLALTDTTATTTALTSLDNLVNGTIDAATVVTITGLIADASNLITSTGIINLDAVDITLTDLSAAATALTTLVGLTTGVIEAASVLTVTGTLAEATAARRNADIHNIGTAAVTLSDATLAAEDLNLLNGLNSGAIDASSVTTLTGSSADVTTALNAAGITGLGNEAVTLNDTSVTAINLNILVGLTSGIINAGSVLLVTGLFADVSAINPANVIGLGLADITLTDASVAVVDVVSIVASTSGIVTATVTEHDVTTLLNLTGTGNALTITITDLTVDPADLNTIASLTTVQIDATASTLISGLVADVLLIDPTLVDLSPLVNITLTNASVSISNLNTVDALTTGIVTATVAENTASDLLTLTGTGNAYTISVVGSNVNALDLTSIDAKTTVNINAAGVVKISGLAADITAVMQAATITGTGNENLSLTDSSISIVNLNAVSLLTGGTTDVVSVGTLSGDSATIAAAFINPALIGVGDINITLTDTISTAVNLNSLDTATNGVINASTVTTLSGSLSNVTTALTSNGLTGLGSVAVTLSDNSATSTDLNSLDALTSGTVNASNVLTITGSISSVSTALKSPGISGLSSVAVTLNDTSANASVLISLDALTSGTINASTVTSVTGTILQATHAFISSGITGLGGAVVISDVTATATNLNLLDAAVTGSIDANSLTTLSGNYDSVLLALGSSGITGILDVNVSLTGLTVDIVDLNSVNTATIGLVSSTTIKTITANADSSLDGSGISMTAINKIILADTVDATFESSTLNGKTITVDGRGNNGGETLTVNGSSVGETINLGGLTIDTNDVTQVSINGLAGNDVIIGTSGNDVIDGGAGVDTLTGGSGVNTFVLASSGLATNDALVATFGDTITDFKDGNSVIAQDVLQINAVSLSHATGFVSNALGLTGASGAQGGNFLVTGAGSQSANAAFAQLLFNTTSGDLSVDADGTGSGAAVLIAHITPGSTLSATDFHFV